MIQLILLGVGIYLVYKFWAVIVKWVLIFSLCSFIFVMFKDTVVEKIKELPIISYIIS
jgi:hypothetical protein